MASKDHSNGSGDRQGAVKDLALSLRGHPVLERPLKTMSDFTKSQQMLRDAEGFSKLARQAGHLLECGCFLPTKGDKEYIRYHIPKYYVPLQRPYISRCAVTGCIHRAIIQKYLNMRVMLEDINVTDELKPLVESNIRANLRKCTKLNLCFPHFQKEFIVDCPTCAAKFGLIPAASS